MKPILALLAAALLSTTAAAQTSFQPQAAFGAGPAPLSAPPALLSRQGPQPARLPDSLLQKLEASSSADFLPIQRHDVQLPTATNPFTAQNPTNPPSVPPIVVVGPKIDPFGSHTTKQSDPGLGGDLHGGHFSVR